MEVQWTLVCRKLSGGIDRAFARRKDLSVRKVQHLVHRNACALALERWCVEKGDTRGGGGWLHILAIFLRALAAGPLTTRAFSSPGGCKRGTTSHSRHKRLMASSETNGSVLFFSHKCRGPSLTRASRIYVVALLGSLLTRLLTAHLLEGQSYSTAALASRAGTATKISVPTDASLHHHLSRGS